MITFFCLAAFLGGVPLLAQPPDHRGVRLDRAFRRFDVDGDDKVSPDELSRPELFRRLDRNGDGVLTIEEVRGRAGRLAAPYVSDAGITVVRDVPYGSRSAQRLDIYSPKQARREPVMLYVHGGGWQRGDKVGIGRKVEFFTGRGWVFVSTNYRLLPDGRHPRNVQDVAAALAWAHDNIEEYGGDPGKLFLMGHSAGAHLVALVATDGRWLEQAGKDPRILRGVISLDTNAYDIPALMEAGRSPLYRQIFGDDPKVWRDASPICHIAKHAGIPPFLICFSRGMQSRVNPMRKLRADAFAKTLRTAGVPAVVVGAQDRNHSEINARFGDPKDVKVTGKATAFLDDILAQK